MTATSSIRIRLLLLSAAAVVSLGFAVPVLAAAKEGAPGGKPDRTPRAAQNPAGSQSNGNGNAHANMGAAADAAGPASVPAAPAASADTPAPAKKPSRESKGSGAASAAAASGVNPMTGGNAVDGKGAKGGSTCGSQQGCAPSNPNGGCLDKPGNACGTAGDRDGNNGTGNDRDCDDDDNGRGLPGHCRTGTPPGCTKKCGPTKPQCTKKCGPSDPVCTSKCAPVTPVCTGSCGGDGPGCRYSASCAPNCVANCGTSGQVCIGGNCEAAAGSGARPEALASGGGATLAAVALPFTGISLGMLLIIAGAAICLGTGLRVLARRRASAARS